MRVTRSATGLLAAPVLLLAACGSSQSFGGGCTLIGADSNVQFGYSKVLRPGPSRDITVRVCLGAVCHTVHEPAGRSQREAQQFGGSGIHGADPIAVRLTITDGSGHPIFRGHTVVTPQQFQPNGPACPPTVWMAGVEASGKHTLTAVSAR